MKLDKVSVKVKIRGKRKIRKMIREIDSLSNSLRKLEKSLKNSELSMRDFRDSFNGDDITEKTPAIGFYVEEEVGDDE